MEVLAPAGNREKLTYAYRFGADAAYIGLQNFSLRSNADNFIPEEAKAVHEIKSAYGTDSNGVPRKKLFGAVNAFFHEDSLSHLEQQLEVIAKFPFDALILSDLGAYSILRKAFPNMQFHLSTQANCLNSEAVKVYRDLGFSRIILAREASLAEVERIKQVAGDTEIEIFVHGAMCMAYSGRCYMSRHLAGRSANQGDCSHSCRWEYRWLEERERPGEYYPVFEGNGFTAILSSRDLCMIDHIEDIRSAGVDSIKIEGRMKSAYYTAVVTRAYRKAVDRVFGMRVPDFEEYRRDLSCVSHREYSTGFYFGKEDMESPSRSSYIQEYQFLGILGEKVSGDTYRLFVKNRIIPPEPIEFIGPDIPRITDETYLILNAEQQPVQQADHNKEHFIRTGVAVEPGFLLRKRIARQNSQQ